jgi:uncharacterized membrane protein YphA (DoxX/SURF4 family)
VTVLAAACRVGVGVVLVLAGFAKLRQPAWAATAERFGTPRPLVPVVPWAELVIGALLVSGAGGRIPVFVALALLGAFTGVMAARLSAGEHSPCGCFGTAAPAPLGRDALVRNGILLAAGLLALGGRGGSPTIGVVVGVLAGVGFVVMARRR